MSLMTLRLRLAHVDVSCRWGSRADRMLMTASINDVVWCVRLLDELSLGTPVAAVGMPALCFSDVRCRSG